ncbi:MAG: glycosyltransferase [Luteitalea sp.]|nr:glycosyltransferase [Luteitalea sp.]
MTLVVPGRLETHTGGYIYDKRIVSGLRARGWPVEVRELDPGFPSPTASALAEAGQVLSAIPDRSIALVDGLALGAMPDHAERERSRLRLVALIHLPLAADAGLAPEVATKLRTSEQRALACASLIVVTGACTRSALAGYGVDPERIALVQPGTDRAPRSRGSGGATLQLLTVATLTRRKGHDVLFRALAALPRHGWHLTCVGSLEREPDTVAALRGCLRDEGLESSISLAGDVDDARLEDYYLDADLFVLATLHETYGMAVAEALAHGLPVVSTTDPAIGELVGEDAGLLVPPGDAAALSDALGRMIGDAGLRARLSAGARRVREQLPSWDAASDRMAAALRRVATGG